MAPWSTGLTTFSKDNKKIYTFTVFGVLRSLVHLCIRERFKL